MFKTLLFLPSHFHSCKHHCRQIDGPSTAEGHTGKGLHYLPTHTSPLPSLRLWQLPTDGQTFFRQQEESGEKRRGGESDRPADMCVHLLQDMHNNAPPFLNRALRPRGRRKDEGVSTKRSFGWGLGRLRTPASTALSRGSAFFCEVFCGNPPSFPWAY